MNSGFYTIVEKKSEEITKQHQDFRTKFHASYYDKVGNKKLRTLEIIQKVFTSIKIFCNVFCYVFHRNVALQT